MSSVSEAHYAKPGTFAEAKDGWHGYVDWENAPDKRAYASKILNSNEFVEPPEFQLVPLPKTNPILIGWRFKQYHEALGLKYIVDRSWAIFQEEKSDMIVVLDFPLNAETRRPNLLADKITDNRHHFIRNHGGIPEINPDRFELEFGGLVKNPTKITLAELKDPERFPQAEVTVTLQCSGTRRIEQMMQYPGDGDELINAPWGMTGTAVYRGVPLKKVLKAACGGVLPDCNHLEFLGADTYVKKGQLYNYAVSVPLRKVRGNEEVLLAWEMNGKPLPKSHGYIGARSCKWLYRVNALPEPSLGPVQQQEYLYYTAQIGKQNAKFSNGFSIQQMPVSSAIIFPQDKDVVIHSGKVTLRGWSYSGGGNWVERVEVSSDGGSVWYAVDQDDMTEKHYHAWRLWKIDLPVDAEGWLEFCVRTWDSSNNTEPTFVRSAWKIKVYSVNKSRPATADRLRELERRGVDFNPITRPLEFALESEQDYAAAMKKHPREPKD
ncbi:sulfite oxidase mitochondrial precursor [Infundibulicybe gibba]|nr:sulfite oxidase mitochondrial precursor [Infundibulicybe gibba]